MSSNLSRRARSYSRPVPDFDRRSEMKRVAIVLVGHGSRIAEANQSFLELADQVRRRTDGLVEPAFVELAEPTIPQALERAVRRGAEEIVIAPFLLLAAGHAKVDIPTHVEAARARFTSVRFTQAAPLGLHPLMVEILSDRITQAQSAAPERAASDTAVLLLGRGSSDPDANSDIYKLGRLLWERRGLATVECAFCGVVEPSLPQGLRKLSRLPYRRVIVAPYLFFSGVLVRRIETALANFRQECPETEALCAPTLGDDPRLLDVLFLRVREAREGLTRMSCDLCKYKVG
jgi:sirohydrochlorin cobaltochelatase